MNEQELRILIEKLIREVVGRMEQDRARDGEPDRSLLFVLTGAPEGHERALDLIRSLGHDARIEVYPGCCYKDRYGIEGLRDALASVRHARLQDGVRLMERERLVREAEGVVLLLPMLPTIAKIARGLADSATTRMIHLALMQGKPVFAAGGEADMENWPESMAKGMRRGPGSLGESVARDLGTLGQWGLVYRKDPMELRLTLEKLAQGKNPDAAAGSPATPPATGEPISFPASGPMGRSFLTAADVRRLHEQGLRELAVPVNCQVTDEARDVAARLGLALRE